MTFKEYQEFVDSVAIYPNVGHNFVYPTLGLVGEAGEIAEKVKKIFRDNGGVVEDEKKEEIKKELGDVLWYIARVGAEFGFTVEDIAELNKKKLLSRRERGTLHGDGDNR
ncbi:MAG: MazG family pyrophosphatase [Parcubacteria group bacterium LiPW_41]|nr:MAG: MazG family pyrophosphatase [Parcubacteria group bacterium LiPW_41]